MSVCRSVRTSVGTTKSQDQGTLQPAAAFLARQIVAPPAPLFDDITIAFLAFHKSVSNFVVVVHVRTQTAYAPFVNKPASARA